MYDDLVKRLRSEAVYLPEKFSKNAELLDVLMKAAEAIEELSRDLGNMNEANIALYGALPKWIPVTEALPEYGEKCLVLFKLISHNDFHISTSYCYVQKEGFWSDCGRDYKATHWMPLPEPPKEES